jgi:thioredoxin reductase (NADPH)
MYDLAIIGAGAAGLTASFYAGLYGLRAVCIGNKVGGKLLAAPFIVDYPGVEGISGKNFVTILESQVRKTTTEVIVKRATAIENGASADNNAFTITTEDAQKYEAKTILITSGNINKQGDKSTQNITQTLGVETENGFIKINSNYQTNIPGIFAAGECIQYPFSLEQLATSVASAMSATAMIYQQLQGAKPPILWGSTTIPRLV